MKMQPGRSAEEAQCIEVCVNCHAQCLETAVVYCLQEGGEHARQSHMRLMLDCAAMCSSAADFGLRASPYFKSVCAVCAQICDDCAESCRALGEGMKACADTCQECAQACRRHSA